ncbi:MAG: CDP-alcohol phosphatidyltransferase family protein [Candidatus Izemoplasmataceae bacterium]
MKKIFTVPNNLSLSRLIFLPLLYVFLWRGELALFFVAFTVLGSTDFFDGYLARKWNQVTKLGKALDTIADMFFYISVAYFLFYLYPQAIVSNRYFLILAFSVYGLSFLVPLIMFKKVYTLHTRILRSNAVLVYFMMLLSFVMNTSLLLSIILVIFVIGFLEEILIFIRYGAVDQDTRSYFSVRLERKLKKIYDELREYKQSKSINNE